MHLCSESSPVRAVKHKNNQMKSELKCLNSTDSLIHMNPQTNINMKLQRNMEPSTKSEDPRRILQLNTEGCSKEKQL